MRCTCRDGEAPPAGKPRVVRLRLVASERLQRNGSGVVASGAWRLALLEGVGDVFAKAGTPAELVEGVADALAGTLADWCLIAPRAPSPAEWPSVLTVRAEWARRAFGRGPPPQVHLIEDVGLGAYLPLVAGLRGGEEVLRLRVDGRDIDLPGIAFMGERLGGPRIRFGSLVVGRTTDEAEFDDLEARVVHRIAAQTSIGLENAELAGEARRAARARDAVVEIVAHDMTTPVNSLSLLVERMVRAAEDADTGSRFMDLAQGARRSLDQIRHLVDDLSDLRDIEQGLFVTRLSSQPVCELLQAAAAEVTATAHDLGVELTLSTEACPLQVLADPDRVVQCLAILLTRAIHVSPRGATVELVPASMGDRAEITVVDRGPVIPPHRLSHLFDHLARGHDGTRRGVRLIIAQEIARAHGEPLMVRSAEGLGTRFVLSLALDAVESEPGALVGGQADATRCNKRPASSISSTRNETTSS